MKSQNVSGKISKVILGILVGGIFLSYFLLCPVTAKAVVTEVISDNTTKITEHDVWLLDPNSPWLDYSFDDSSWNNAFIVWAGNWTMTDLHPTGEFVPWSGWQTLRTTGLNDPKVILASNGVFHESGYKNFFRKRFTIPSDNTITKAKLYVFSDNLTKFWINKSPVNGTDYRLDNEGDCNIKRGGNAEGGIVTYDVTNQVKAGDNILSGNLLNWQACNSSHPVGVQFYLYIEHTPPPPPSPPPPPAPVCDFIVSPAAGNSGYEPAGNNYSSNGVLYTWTFSDDAKYNVYKSISPNYPSRRFFNTTQADQTYKITLTVYNSADVSDTCEQTITVYPQIGGWWQVVEGIAHANSSLAGSVRSSIPIGTCLVSPCFPYLFENTGILTVAGSSVPDFSPGTLVNNLAPTDKGVFGQSGAFGGTRADYAYWAKKLESWTESLPPLPFGSSHVSLPALSVAGATAGIFKANPGNSTQAITIGNNGDISWENISRKQIVILHQGDITIDGNITINSAEGGALMVITPGNIIIEPGVTKVHGVYIAGQGITTQSVISPTEVEPETYDTQLEMQGNFISWGGVVFNRNLGSLANGTQAAEVFKYRPDIINALRHLSLCPGVKCDSNDAAFNPLLNFQHTWQEIVP